MFFSASKLLWLLAVPSNLLPVLGLLGLALGLRRPRLGGALAALSLAALLAFGLSPLARLVVLPLEQRFPAHAGEAPVTGIIVLGGSVESLESTRRGQFVTNGAGERMLALGDLARRYPDARLVFSGGPGPLGAPGSEATAVRRFAGSLGVEPDRITFEGTSRNTRENAAFTAAIVPPKAGERWLLVTSAFHMPRAVGCFRAVGYEIVAYPVDYRTAGSDDRQGFVLGSDGLSLLDFAAKEWVGLVAYRLAGYIDALWPGP